VVECLSVFRHVGFFVWQWNCTAIDRCSVLRLLAHSYWAADRMVILLVRRHSNRVGSVYPFYVFALGFGTS
jgi:hypothetical protein